MAIPPTSERPPVAVQAGNPAAGGLKPPGPAIAGCEDTEAPRSRPRLTPWPGAVCSLNPLQLAPADAVAGRGVLAKPAAAGPG